MWGEECEEECEGNQQSEATENKTKAEQSKIDTNYTRPRSKIRKRKQMKLKEKTRNTYGKETQTHCSLVRSWNINLNFIQFWKCNGSNSFSKLYLIVLQQINIIFYCVKYNFYANIEFELRTCIYWAKYSWDLAVWEEVKIKTMGSGIAIETSQCISQNASNIVHFVNLT